MMLKRHLQMLRIGVLWLATASPLLAQEAWQDPYFMQDAFIQVVLKNEYGPARLRVRKWQQPIKLWLEDQTPEAAQHATLVNIHSKHLASLTGLSIERAPNIAQANFFVVFSLGANWHAEVERISGQVHLKPPRDAACMFGIQTDAASKIQRAWVVIPVDHASEHRALLSCVVEEMTQALGLPNDADSVYPSIFNDKTPEALLTGLDVVLIQLLYQPQVKAGMTQMQVLPVVKQLLRLWQQNGHIDQAERLARQTPFVEMMGYE